MSFRSSLQTHQTALDLLDVPPLGLIEETNRALIARLGSLDISAPRIDIDALLLDLLELRRNNHQPTRRQLRYAGWAAMTALSRDYGAELLTWVLDLALAQRRARPVIEVYGAYLHSGFGHPVADRLVPPALTGWLAKAESPRVRALRTRSTDWGTLAPGTPGKPFAVRLHDHAMTSDEAWSDAGISDYLKGGAFAKAARLACLSRLQMRLTRNPGSVSVTELERITSILDD